MIRENKVNANLKHPGLFADHFGSEFLHFWKLSPDRVEMDNPSYRKKWHEKDGRVIKNTIFHTNNLINAVSMLSTGPLFFFAIIGTLRRGSSRSGGVSYRCYGQRFYPKPNSKLNSAQEC